MQDKLISVVTGANRGIGHEIARRLAQIGHHTIIATRNEAKGEAAKAELQNRGFDASFQQLDVTDPASIAAAIAAIAERHGKIDILINNAAVLLDGPGGFDSRLSNVTPDIALATLQTNVVGPLLMIQTVVPIMQRNGYGRIVNVSSLAGQLTGMGAGFPAYRISKAALNALTRTASSEIDSGTDITINSMCPGWVRTDMGGADAERSVEQGADTAIWLATHPRGGPRGGFFRDRRPVAW